MRLLQIDAFTSEPFKGNPAAVCFLDGARDDRWMANVAAEMNLSETAFLLPGDDGWSLRWFTPAVEVDLCGHATLASAHAIWSENISTDAVLRFHTRSGVLTAKRDGDFIELDFPAKREEPIAAPAGLLDALGVTHATYVGRNQFDYIVELPSEDEVRAICVPITPCCGNCRCAASSSPAARTRASTTSCRASSRRARASMKIPSPARPTAASLRTGRNASARTSSTPGRPLPEVAPSASGSTAIA